MISELIPKMSEEEWAKCRQILRLCTTSLLVVDIVEDLASKHEEVSLAELYDAVGRIHPELRDVATRLLNNIVQHISKNELEDSDEMRYFIYIRLVQAVVTREGLLRIADDARIVHNLLCT